jgi:hypothetical protein
MVTRKTAVFEHDERLPSFECEIDMGYYGIQKVLIQVLTLNLNAHSMRVRVFDPDTKELKYGVRDISLHYFHDNCIITNK